MARHERLHGLSFGAAPADQLDEAALPKNEVEPRLHLPPEGIQVEPRPSPHHELVKVCLRSSRVPLCVKAHAVVVSFLRRYLGSQWTGQVEVDMVRPLVHHLEAVTPDQIHRPLLDILGQPLAEENLISLPDVQAAATHEAVKAHSLHTGVYPAPRAAAVDVNQVACRPGQPDGPACAVRDGSVPAVHQCAVNIKKEHPPHPIASDF